MVHRKRKFSGIVHEVQPREFGFVMCRRCAPYRTNNTYPPARPNFLSEGVRFVLSQKLPPWDSTFSTAQDGSFWDRAKMCPLSQEIQFLRRRLQIQRSAKKMRMGCTTAYCPFAFIFVSGSRCLPYRVKFTSYRPYQHLPLQDLLVGYPPSSLRVRTRWLGT